MERCSLKINYVQYFYTFYQILFHIFLFCNKYSRKEMVVCLYCKTELGNWNLKIQSAYNNGAYLGLNCYFAYSGPNWVYCICQTCYNNGQFANYIKSWYAAPIKSIIDAEAINKIAEIKQLEDKLTNKQLQNTQLQDKIKKLQSQINQLEARLAMVNQLEAKVVKFQHQSKLISEESFKLIAKTENYDKQLKEKFNIYSLQFITQLSSKINTLIKGQSQEFIVSYKHKLNQMKSNGEKDIESLKTILAATISSWKSQKNYANNNLFEDSEVQSCQKIFLDKIKKIQKNLELIFNSQNQL